MAFYLAWISIRLIYYPYLFVVFTSQCGALAVPQCLSCFSSLLSPLSFLFPFFFSLSSPICSRYLELCAIESPVHPMLVAPLFQAMLTGLSFWWTFTLVSNTIRRRKKKSA